MFILIKIYIYSGIVYSGVINVGNFDSEYKSYYGKIMERKRNAHLTGKISDYPTTVRNTKVSEKSINHVIFRRITQELGGTLVLLLTALICKNIRTPETMAVYNSGKYFVNNGYDINQAARDIKYLDISSIKHKGEDLTDYVKSKVMNGQTFKEKMKETLVKPVLGTYSLKDDSKKIYSVEVSSGTEVISIGDGKVSETGEDAVFNRYVMIDCGNGIESVYGNLENIDVKEGEVVFKGQMIGNIGSSGAKTALLFQLKYMGEARDIKEYMNI